MALSGSPVVILGVHRSGTSAVSQALSKLGLFMGKDEDFFSADSRNTQGYYELREQILLNRNISKAFLMAYPGVEPLPPHWRDYPFSPSIITAIDKVLSKYFSDRSLWGWKEPNTTMFLPLYKEALERHRLQAHHLLCVRNPLSVLESRKSWEVGTAKRREPALGEVALGLWLHYTLFALYETIGYSRTVLLYHEYLQSPRAALEPTVHAIPGWRPSALQWEEAVSTVRPDLNHGQKQLGELGTQPRLIRETWALCEEASVHPVRLREGALDDRIRELWREFSQLHEILGDLRPPEGHLELKWNGGTVDAEFLTRQWQTLRFSMPPGAVPTLQVALYPRPSVLWIRKAAAKIDASETPARIAPGPQAQIEQEEGAHRLLTLPGPVQFEIQVPNLNRPYELALEILVDANPTTGFMAAGYLMQRALAKK